MATQRIPDWLYDVVAQDGLLIVGLTACGRATAAALNLNDRYHLSARAVWIIARAYPPATNT